MSRDQVQRLLRALPAVYDHRDVLERFPSRDAFLDAYAKDLLPQEVQKVIEASLSPTTLQTWLIARLLRVWLPDDNGLGGFPFATSDTSVVAVPVAPPPPEPLPGLPVAPDPFPSSALPPPPPKKRWW